MTRKPLVIVTRKLPDAIETRMAELFNVRLNLDDTAMSQAQLVEAVKAADVLVPTVTDRIDAAVLSQAGEKLRLIASFGTEQLWTRRDGSFAWKDDPILAATQTALLPENPATVEEGYIRIAPVKGDGSEQGDGEPESPR